MANVHNIRNRVEFHHSDRFFIDTNVWFWFTYAASNEIQTPNSPGRYQLQRYPEFIEKILDEGASLYHSPLMLSELTNVIERTECEIYNYSNDTELTRKEFRLLTPQREKVIREVSNAWQQVTSMSTTLELTINAELANSALITLSDYSLDAYDAFYAKSMSDYGIENIVTDDADFSGLDLNLYTANNRLI
ncbi:PIN domain-containing protein [Vibrio parahaemolyticus]|nr:PIN domain-containing protein [Vibrio parahaemolyticus]